MLHTRGLGGTLEVDGQAFDWKLRREPQWCTEDGWKGMVIALRLQDEQREALLEFPMPKRPLNGSPQLQRPQINDAIVGNGIRAALAAGWEPTSRGKPVTFLVDANGR
jgi:hypothetical protein